MQKIEAFSLQYQDAIASMIKLADLKAWNDSGMKVGRVLSRREHREIVLKLQANCGTHSTKSAIWRLYCGAEELYQPLRDDETSTL